METRKNLIAQLPDCGMYRRSQVFKLGFIDNVRWHRIDQAAEGPQPDAAFHQQFLHVLDYGNIHGQATALWSPIRRWNGSKGKRITRY